MRGPKGVGGRSGGNESIRSSRNQGSDGGQQKDITTKGAVGTGRVHITFNLSTTCMMDVQQQQRADGRESHSSISVILRSGKRVCFVPWDQELFSEHRWSNPARGVARLGVCTKRPRQARTSVRGMGRPGGENPEDQARGGIMGEDGDAKCWGGRIRLNGRFQDGEHDEYKHGGRDGASNYISMFVSQRSGYCRAMHHRIYEEDDAAEEHEPRSIYGVM